MSPSMNSFCASCAADRWANPATARATVTTDNVLACNFRASIIERSLNFIISPHPEEAALLGGRLEGWQRVRPEQAAILRDAVLRTAPQDEGLHFFTRSTGHQGASGSSAG